MSACAAGIFLALYLLGMAWIYHVYDHDREDR